MDVLLERRTRSNHHEIPLAPILDLLVIVVFFLVLSVGFVEFTKQTLPPASVSTVNDPATPPPLAPKFLITADAKNLNLLLTWQGTTAGSSEDHLTLEEAATPKKIMQKIGEMASQFKANHPEEKSIQLGLANTLTYQTMVAAMDGLQQHLPDVILMSYTDVNGLTSTTVKGGKDARNP